MFPKIGEKFKKCQLFLRVMNDFGRSFLCFFTKLLKAGDLETSEINKKSTGLLNNNNRVFSESCGQQICLFTLKTSLQTSKTCYF